MRKLTILAAAMVLILCGWTAARAGAPRAGSKAQKSLPPPAGGTASFVANAARNLQSLVAGQAKGNHATAQLSAAYSGVTLPQQKPLRLPSPSRAMSALKGISWNEATGVPRMIELDPQGQSGLNTSQARPDPATSASSLELK